MPSHPSGIATSGTRLLIPATVGQVPHEAGLAFFGHALGDELVTGINLGAEALKAVVEQSEGEFLFFFLDDAREGVDGNFADECAGIIDQLACELGMVVVPHIAQIIAEHLLGNGASFDNRNDIDAIKPPGTLEDALIDRFGIVGGSD